MDLDGRGLTIETGARAGAPPFSAYMPWIAPAQLTPPRAQPPPNAGRGGTPTPDSRKRAAEEGATGAAATATARREASLGYRPPGRVPSPGATARAIESLQRWRSETPSSAEGSPRLASGSPRAAAARTPFAAPPRPARPLPHRLAHAGGAGGGAAPPGAPGAAGRRHEPGATARAIQRLAAFNASAAGEAPPAAAPPPGSVVWAKVASFPWWWVLCVCIIIILLLDADLDLPSALLLLCPLSH
jgi:hypothetical protein